MLQLLVLEGASYRLTNGLSLLTLMERVMKNNKLCHEYGHVHACNGSILYLRCKHYNRLIIYKKKEFGMSARAKIMDL